MKVTVNVEIEAEDVLDGALIVLGGMRGRKIRLYSLDAAETADPSHNLHLDTLGEPANDACVTTDDNLFCVRKDQDHRDRFHMGVAPPDSIPKTPKTTEPA